MPDDIPGGSYSETTRGIVITVQPYYLEDQSVPEARHFVWAYHVKIENRGRETVRLIKRHWQITDSMGKVQDVRGEGVVGKQPTLKPGETFEYASGTPLATPSGIMVGTYQMLGEDGVQFDARIPAFSLDSPYSTKAIH